MTQWPSNVHDVMCTLRFNDRNIARMHQTRFISLEISLQINVIRSICGNVIVFKSVNRPNTVRFQQNHSSVFGNRCSAHLAYASGCPDAVSSESYICSTSSDSLVVGSRIIAIYSLSCSGHRYLRTTYCIS